ncbi:MAG: tetratricopeptide repeat protein [Rhodocyclales bacterium]|nr:tetratricopeptide repeat protein [Rhodocyclales bacterium]
MMHHDKVDTAMKTSQRRWHRTAAALVASGWAVLVLSGCATGYFQHKEGMQLIDEGRYEEGLAKLDEAVRAGPEHLSYKAAYLTHKERAVATLLGAAEAERRAGRPEQARAVYQRVLRLDPNNTPAAAGLAVLEADMRHAAIVSAANDAYDKGNHEAARAILAPLLLEDPVKEDAQMLLRRLDQKLAHDASSGPNLRGKFKKPVTLQFRDANLKMVFEALSRTSGINVLLDKDVKADIRTSIFVKDVSVEDAIDLILLQNQLEKKIVSDNTVFIYPNQPAKLKDYQDLKIRSFHLSNADPKQMLTMLKTLLKTKDIFVHEKTNSIVIRDTPEAIRLAERLIADQDSPEPEVMLEVEVLEVQRSNLTEIGIKYPDYLTLTAKGTPAASGSASTVTVDDLRNLNGSTILTTPALAVGFNLHSGHGDVNVLASPRIRAKNREKAKIMIGDRVPVITNAITPVASGSPVVTGNVQYLDVGLKLEVEPDVNPDNLVAIKVNLEVSSIAKEVPNAQSGTLAYQIGTRNASTVLRLRDGETQVLAGLISDQDRKTTVEVPYLGLIPVLGRLFSSHRDDISKSEIVLSITPRIVRAAKARDARELEYWSGTETTLRNAPLVLKPVGSVSVSSTGAPAAATAAPARPVPPPPGTPVASASRARVPVVAGSLNRNPPPAGAAAATPPAAPAADAAAGGEDGPPAVDVPPPGTEPLTLGWQGPSQARVGDRISLSINSTSGLGVRALGLLVSYDAAVLKAVDVVEGDLLKQIDPTASFTRTIDQGSGQIVVDLASPVGTAGRNGTVATVTFEVIGAAAESAVTISRIVPAGANGEVVSFVTPASYKLGLGQ